MRMGLTTTAIFGDLSGYFFGIFRDKASSIVNVIVKNIYRRRRMSRLRIGGAWSRMSINHCVTTAVLREFTRSSATAEKKRVSCACLPRLAIWRHATRCRPVTDCKMNDLEWPWVAIWRQNPFSANCCSIDALRLLQPTAQIWMKIDSYYQRQKCRPMNLVSENIRFMRIFVVVTIGGGVKWKWGWRRRQFLAIWVATSSESSEIRSAVLYGDMLPVVGR